jgi:hypothetical protein
MGYRGKVDEQNRARDLRQGKDRRLPVRCGSPNCDPRMVLLHVEWLRRCFLVDPAAMWTRLYLHEGLDLEAANSFWAALTGIPRSRFRTPYRAVADPSIRRSKHPMGCPSIAAGGRSLHREVMGLVDGLLSSPFPSGVAQLVEQGTVNAKVLGSSPSPGAPDGVAEGGAVVASATRT